MPITSGEIQFRLSGGASNSDPVLSLGGVKSSVAVTGSTFFDTVTGAESASGDVEYRCGYVNNSNGSLSMLGTKIWIEAQSPAYFAIALAPEGLNATAAAVTGEGTAPSGITWSTTATSEGAALTMGDIPAGQHYAFRLRRTIPASASAVAATYTIRVKCDTAA